ncbi:patatin-like phospholipase family protein [Nocardia paucivorans]|uniref:patatin-like phospholipase family protein n=1 Tax=Nocardia paucivorans TaxID=114259 RepID=UPI00031FB490|nr:patatin-like phospholipase family protein [Nocardia paucivorans]
MSDALLPDSPRTALVLGGGGPVGIAWLAGLAVGLRDAGIDLSAADRIVGTSAGAVVGAVLAGGGDLNRLLTPQPSDSLPVAREFGPLLEIAGLLRTRGPEREQAIRRAAELAISTATGDQEAHIDRIGSLIGFADWPDHDLVVTSVDLSTGELHPWTRDGGASLVRAVASSTSVPGVFPPILIDGRHYVDGGVRSSINADLAADAETVVILEPLAHLFPRTRADRELGSARVISIVPDAGAITAFGADLFAGAALLPAYEAGVRQAGEATTQLGKVLSRN